MFYISQINENDCGYACVRIMLANLHHNENALYLNFNNDKKMASYFDLVKCAKEYGVTLIPFKCEDSFDGESSSLPSLLETNVNGNGHLVYMYKANKKYVYYLDPAKGKIKQKIGEFNAIWNKRGLYISAYKNDPKYQKTNFTYKSETVSLLLFQIASSLCCVLGFHFMDTKYPIYLPIVMCLLFGAMEFGLRKYALIIMRRIDRRLEEAEGYVKEENFKNYFVTRQELKKTLIVNSMTIFGAICILGLCIFFLAMSNPYNLIYVAVSLILGFISGIVINKKMIKKNSIISYEENNISNCHTFVDLKSSINNINELGMDYAHAYLAWKFVVICICAITSVVFMFALKLSNPAYIVLMTMITYLMYQQFENIFMYNARKNTKNSLLVKFTNLFQKHS